MSCCEPEEQEEPKNVTEEKKDKKNLGNKGDEDEGERDKGAKNIWTLGLGVILIVGLLAWLV